MAWTLSVGTFVSAVAWSQGWQARIPLSYDTLGGCWLACCAGVDIVISLTLYLAIRRSILGFNKTTDRRILVIMRTSVLTASYTSGKHRSTPSGAGKTR